MGTIELVLAVGFLDSSSVVLLLSALGLVSFALIFVTSFVKIIIVLGLLRSALGVPRVPPSSVLAGIAIILSFYIMYPVFHDVYETTQPHFIRFAGATGNQRVEELVLLAKEGSKPFKAFLSRHAHAQEKETFSQLSKELHKGKGFSQESAMVLVPSFLMSEIKEAFIIGFLLFLPFLILDLLAANILMAMGMHMLSPTSVSLPFKLLLFISVDGFSLLAHALIKSYAVV